MDPRVTKLTDFKSYLILNKLHLQNNSTGPTKVFVASLDCLTNGWISLNHRHSIESNGCRSKIHCHSIYTVDHFPTIHSLTMVL